MQKGFTLVETLIYIAIIAVSVSSFVVFAISVSDSKSKTYVVQEVQGNMRGALGLMTQRMRAATGVNTASSTFGVDPGVLSLVMAESAKNPTIIDLSADDGILQITEGLESPVAIISDEVRVINLVFEDLTPTGEREHIRFQITVEYNNTSGDSEYDYSQTLQSAVSIRQ